jgi:ribose transport system permease protein
MTPRREWLALAGALVLLVIGFSLATDHFFSWTTMVALANQAPEALLLATGMTLVVLTGGIDLSVGSVLALSAAIFGTVVESGHLGLPAAACAALAVGAGCGVANGWLSSRWQIPSFIVTLAMLEIARGATYLVTDSQTRYLGARVDVIASDVIGGLRAPVLVAVAVVIGAQWALTHTVFGRHIVAVGANDEAARLAGIDPRRVRTLAFTLCGTLAGMAAVVQTGRLAAADPNAGVGLELEAIAAVVIGGTSLFGGAGSMVGTVAGTIMLGALANVLQLNNITPALQLLATAAIIVLAAVLQSLVRRREGLIR